MRGGCLRPPTLPSSSGISRTSGGRSISSSTILRSLSSLRGGLGSGETQTSGRERTYHTRGSSFHFTTRVAVSSERSLTFSRLQSRLSASSVLLSPRNRFVSFLNFCSTSPSVSGFLGCPFGKITSSSSVFPDFVLTVLLFAIPSLG